MDTATVSRIRGQRAEDYRFCLCCAALSEPQDAFCASCGACLGDRITHDVGRCAPCQAVDDRLAA